MKVGMKFGLVAVAMVSLSAFGVHRPGWERPVYNVPLEQIDGDGRYPRPTNLMINKQSVAKQFTSFKLVEDTGVRCITTPCPSEQTTVFYVTGVSKNRGGSTIYEASTLRSFPLGIVVPKPGTVVRTIQLFDHSTNRLARYKYRFVLKIQGKHDAHTYGGNGEAVATPAGGSVSIDE